MGKKLNFRSADLKAVRSANGIILVFDFTRRDSFEHLENWISTIKDNFNDDIIIVLFGNKIDLGEEYWQVTSKEAKEYALCYANANSHITGNRNTMITHLEPKEDHRRRVERYEAYQAYRKYYKEIMDVIVNFDGYPDYTSGGALFLKEAILKEVP